MIKQLTHAQIVPYEQRMLLETSNMLALAFATNPLHEIAFDRQVVEKNKAFFQTALTRLKGTKLVAIHEDQILGFIHWVPSKDCQFSLLEKMLMTPSMINRLGFESSIRTSLWLSAWSKHDPKKAHIHLGPIGVHPQAQGSGIGRLLMNCYCGKLDMTGQEGYLETDREENVQFYRQFGFKLVQELPVLGIRNYFMWRQAN